VFRSSYLPFTLSTASHRSAFGISPFVQGIPGGAFSGNGFYAFGGCPLIGDFDVMTPVGGSSMEMSFGPPASSNGVILSHVTSPNGPLVKAMLSGFSFMRIRDDETDGVLDRARQLYDILTWLGNAVDQPTPTTAKNINLLMQNYPNPFNPVTTIGFSLAVDADVELKIFDARGALVRTILRGHRPAGENRVTWDGKNEAGASVASGVFFYRLSTDGFTSTRKMVLLK